MNKQMDRNSHISILYFNIWIYDDLIFAANLKSLLFCQNWKPLIYVCTEALLATLQILRTIKIHMHIKFSVTKKMSALGWLLLAPAQGCSLQLQRWGPSGPTMRPSGPAKNIEKQCGKFCGYLFNFFLRKSI